MTCQRQRRVEESFLWHTWLFCSFKCSCHAKVAWSKPHSKISIAPATSSYRQGRQLHQSSALIGQQQRQRPIGSALSFGGTCPYLRLAGPAFGPLQFRHRRDQSSISDPIHRSNSYNGQGSLQSWWVSLRFNQENYLEQSLKVVIA